MTINEFNYNFLSEIERKVIDFFDEFRIISSKEIMQFDKRSNSDRATGNYLRNFNVYSDAHFKIFILINIIFICL